MAQVRAARSGVITINGVPTPVREGEAFDAKDEVVQQFRWMFESPVEEATANPGQRRTRS